MAEQNLQHVLEYWQNGHLDLQSEIRMPLAEALSSLAVDAGMHRLTGWTVEMCCPRGIRCVKGGTERSIHVVRLHAESPFVAPAGTPRSLELMPV